MPSIHARMHTAEHMLFRSMINYKPELEIIKVETDEEETKFFVYGKLDWDTMLNAEELVNKIISEERDVKIKEIPIEEARKDDSIRGRFDLIKEKNVRLVEVDGFDKCLCSGEHVKNTKEIGKVLVTGFNSLGKKSEIRFKLDAFSELYGLAGIARKLTTVMGVETGNLVPAITILRSNYESSKKQLRELQNKLEIKPEVKSINGITYYHYEFDNYEKQQLNAQANKLLKENSVVVFTNKTERVRQILIYSNSRISAIDLLKRVTKKGGGNEKSAMGVVENDEIKRILHEKSN
ncbi:hypothetical protein JXA85_01070 [Candidatus Woesearchaeota archaeon]|nr:hypothetical protein [Candidatus Woesearchaeota archaeon]